MWTLYPKRDPPPILPIISIRLLGYSFSINSKTCTWLKIGNKGLGVLGRLQILSAKQINTVCFTVISFNVARDLYSPPLLKSQYSSIATRGNHCLNVGRIGSSERYMQLKSLFNRRTWSKGLNKKVKGQIQSLMQFCF